MFNKYQFNEAQFNGQKALTLSTESVTNSQSEVKLQLKFHLTVTSMTYSSSSVFIGELSRISGIVSKTKSISSVDLTINPDLVPVVSTTNSFSFSQIQIENRISTNSVSVSSSSVHVTLKHKLNLVSPTTLHSGTRLNLVYNLSSIVSTTTSRSYFSAYIDAGYGILIEGGSGSQAPEILTIPADVINVEEGTVEIEVDVNDTLLNSSKAVLFSAVDDTDSNHLQLFYEQDQWIFRIKSNGVVTDIAVQDDLNKDVHVFAITWSNEEANLYINGVERSFLTLPSLPSELTQVGVGHWVADGTAQLNSVIANLRISNKALTNDELLNTIERGFKINEYTTAFMDFEQNINYTNPLNVSDKAVLKGELYNGISITEEDGFLAVRSDERVMTVLNATDGFAIQTRPNTSSPWNAKLYADTSGNLYLDGTLVAAKGSFTGSLQAASGTFAGSLQAVDGTFTGDLIAAGGTFTGTLQAVDGVFTGTLNAVNGTFTGELVGASGTFTGDLIGGRIFSDDITFVGTNLYVTNNLYLGDQYGSGSKAIYFNNGAYIEGATGPLEVGIALNGSEIEMLQSTLIYLGTDVEYTERKGPGHFESDVAETGWCGIGGVTDPAIGAANQVIVGVNFRIKKRYTPSSVSLSTVTSNTNAGVTDISSDGFSLYIQKGPAKNFYYWRGRYTA